MKNKNTALHTAYDVLKTYIGNVPHVWNKDGKRNKDVTTFQLFQNFQHDFKFSR